MLPIYTAISISAVPTLIDMCQCTIADPTHNNHEGVKAWDPWRSRHFMNLKLQMILCLVILVSDQGTRLGNFYFLEFHTSGPLYGPFNIQRTNLTLQHNGGLGVLSCIVFRSSARLVTGNLAEALEDAEEALTIAPKYPEVSWNVIVDFTGH